MVVYSTDRSKAVVPVLVLLFVALWFILQGDLFYVLIFYVLIFYEFLCISVLRVASGPRVKLASCKSALNPPVVYSTDRSKAVVPVLVLLFVALWFILRGDLFYVLIFYVLIFYKFLCISVLRVASGTRVKLASCKNALTPPLPGGLLY